MKFYVYDKDKLEECIHESQWCCTRIDEKYIGCKPLLNNSYHHITNISLLEQTTSEECDYFLVPYYIRHTHHFKDDDMLDAFLNKNLDFYGTSPEKHIFFLASDDTRPIKALEKSIVFAFSTTKESKNICLHYQPIIKPPGKISNIELCRFDISFQGYICNQIRKKSVMQIEKLNSVVINNRYWFHKFMGIDTTEMERNYSGLMQMSKFILCPRGFGTNSIRFFEAMAFGRLPVLIADSTKLPLENKIRYNDFIVRVKEDELESLPDVLEKNKKDLIEKSKIARTTWENYFSPCKLPFFMQESLNNA